MRVISLKEPTITSAPASDAVTTAEAKAQLIIDHSTDDAYIGNLITRAQKWVENYLGIKLITQTIQEVFDQRSLFYTLSWAPVISVTTFEYYADGSYSSWATSNIVTDTQGRPASVMIHPDSQLPTTDKVFNKVRITYTCGYGTASDVPEDIKQAILMKVASFYEKRIDYKRRYADASLAMVRNYKNWL